MPIHGSVQRLVWGSCPGPVGVNASGKWGVSELRGTIAGNADAPESTGLVVGLACPEALGMSPVVEALCKTTMPCSRALSRWSRLVFARLGDFQE